MNCSEAEGRLDAYVDGLLSAEGKSAVERHLSTCLPCNRSLAGIRSLLDEARQLPEEIEPESDLWPGIESRITAEPAVGHQRGHQRPPRITRWGGLAAAATLVFAALTILWWVEPGSEGRADRVSWPVATEAVPAIEAKAMLARSEDGVLLPKADLAATLAWYRGVLDPETVAAMEEGARALDHAIGQICEALEQNPGDRHLELLLASRYQQEVDLLKRVSHV